MRKGISISSGRFSLTYVDKFTLAPKANICNWLQKRIMIMFNSRILIILCMVVIPFMNGCTCISVDGGSVGVKKVWGELQAEPLLEGGPYIFNALTTDVEFVSTRIQKLDVKAAASSKDLQIVTTKLILNFRLDPLHVVETYRTIGDLRAVADNIVAPAIQESIKMSTAQFTAAELVTHRADAKRAITADITKTLLKNHIVVTEVSVTNFQFDKQYQDAVESKQIAEQKAQQATNDLERIKVEALQEEVKAAGVAKARVIRAEAEAKSQELIRKTITPEIVYLRAIEKWDGRQPQVVTNGGTLVDFSALGVKQ